MTSLGFPGLSSQSVSGLFGPFWPKNPKRIGMTSLGFPSLSSQSVSGFSLDPAHQLSAFPGPCRPVVRLPWTLPTNCPPSLDLARQLSAFPGPCPPIVRLPWTLPASRPPTFVCLLFLPASCPPALDSARQLSAFPGPCPPVVVRLPCTLPTSCPPSLDRMEPLRRPFRVWSPKRIVSLCFAIPIQTPRRIFSPICTSKIDGQINSASEHEVFLLLGMHANGCCLLMALACSLQQLCGCEKCPPSTWAPECVVCILSTNRRGTIANPCVCVCVCVCVCACVCVCVCLPLWVSLRQLHK